MWFERNQNSDKPLDETVSLIGSSCALNASRDCDNKSPQSFYLSKKKNKKETL